MPRPQMYGAPKCMAPRLQVIPTNTRAACAVAMEKAKAEEPWFGIEQEYTLLSATTKRPLGVCSPRDLQIFSTPRPLRSRPCAQAF